MGPLYLEFNNSTKCILLAEDLPTLDCWSPRGPQAFGRSGGSPTGLSHARAMTWLRQHTIELASRISSTRTHGNEGSEPLISLFNLPLLA